MSFDGSTKESHTTESQASGALTEASWGSDSWDFSGLSEEERERGLRAAEEREQRWEQDRARRARDRAAPPFEVRVHGDPDEWAPGGRRDPGSGAPWEKREQTLGVDPLVCGFPTGKPLRRLVWGMAEALVRYGCSSTCVADCHRARWKGEVDVMVRGELPEPGGTRSAFYRGLKTCASVWACPICMRKIKTGKAMELKKLVAHHGPERVEMLTLTVRHSKHDRLEPLKIGLTDAWELFKEGKDWAAFRRRYGIVGVARAFEVTHGQHGWHPHLHVLIFLERPVSDEERKVLRDALAARWRRVVLKSGLGELHEPDDQHGCCLTPIRQSDYLSKLGLEIADVYTKRGRGKESRTPLQIAHDILVHNGRRADVALWREYVVAIKGTYFLTFSKEIQKLRKLLGLRATEEELAAQEDGPPEVEPVCVASIGGPRWYTLCRVRGARERILTRAELTGAEGVEMELDVCDAAVEESILEQAARAPV